MHPMILSLRQRITSVASCALLAAIAAAALLPLAASAASWRDHAQPYVFLFGNDIDTHQQTFLQERNELFGFFYIKFTGDVTSDGLRVARHVNCSSEPGCTAGWQLNGRAATAKYLYHAMPDHPVWLIERTLIPQPGYYTHFHWLGAHPTKAGEVKDGFLLELLALDTFCFVLGGTAHGRTASGNGSCTEIGGLKVVPGIDTSTHTNIVTSVPSKKGH